MRRMRLGVMLAIVVAGLSASPAAEKRPNPEGLSEPVYAQAVIETARVPMRDGETLFVEIKRPVVPAGVQVPVILTLSPYNNLGAPFPPEVTSLTDGESLAEFFVPRGYARAIADVRGTRESSGCWDYGGEKERHDGYDLVEWLGTQPWSNGRVGMIGASYEGTTANAAAVERPPHLSTIVPIASIDRWYDYAYINGVRWFLNSESTTDEGFDTPAGFDFGLAVPPPVDARAPEFADALADRYGPCDQLEHTQHGYSTQPDYDAFWLERDYRTRAEGITIPILVGHGLDDFNVKATGGLEMFRRARGPKRMVIGQWTHATPENSENEWDNLVWRWFDKWLLGLETGVMKDRTVDVEDSRGEWHLETTWPPATAKERTVWLEAGGALTATAPAAGEVTFFDDPTMREDAMITEGDDPGRVLYLGAPLATETRIAGEPSLTLRMRSDKTSTHIAAVLAVIGPDGSVERISRGFMNPRYRAGLSKGIDLVPGEAFTVSFALSPADHVLSAGSRLALGVAGSNMIWALPDLQRANNTVLSGGPGASRLTLPIVGTASVAGTKTVGPKPAPRPRAGTPAGDPGQLAATGTASRTGLAVTLIALAALFGMMGRPRRAGGRRS